MGSSFRPITRERKKSAQSGTYSAPRASAKPSVSANGAHRAPVSWVRVSSAVRAPGPKDCPVRPAVLTPCFFVFFLTDEMRWRQSRGERCVSLCRLQRCWGQEYHSSFPPFFLPGGLKSDSSLATSLRSMRNTCQSEPLVYLACGLNAHANVVVCVCVHWLHECLSARQMGLIFRGSRKVHTFLLLAGSTDCFHCWLPK